MDPAPRPAPGVGAGGGKLGRTRRHSDSRLASSSNTRKTPVSIYDFVGHDAARPVSYPSYAYPELPAQDLSTLAGLVAAGRLDPAVSLTLPWTRRRDALAALAKQRISGKAVLTVG